MTSKTTSFLIYLLISFNLIAQNPVTSIAPWKNNATAAYNIIHDDFGDQAVIGINNFVDTMAFNRGLKITFGAITEKCESNPAMYVKAKEMVYDHFHEIINHSHTHTCAVYREWCTEGLWAEPSSEKFNIEIDLSTSHIENKVGVRPRYFIYPYDQFNAAANSYLKSKGYIGSRTGAYDTENLSSMTSDAEGFFRDAFIVDATADKAQNLNYWVDQAITNKRWVNRELHNVGETGWGRVSLADYRNHLNYVKSKVTSGQLWVGTISEMLTYQLQKTNYTPSAVYDANAKRITVNWNKPALDMATYLNKLYFKTPITLNVDISKHLGNYVVKQNGVVITDTKPFGNFIAINVYPHLGPVILEDQGCNLCIISNPLSATLVQGTSHTLSVVAQGSSISYQWYKDSKAILNATSANYSITSASAVHEGTYYVVITNASGTLTSKNAVITLDTQKAFPSGTPWPIPGIVQAENFDLGGQNISYNELSSINEGNDITYRTGPVDIESFIDGTTSARGVGYTLDNEWLEYTIDVKEAGNYNILLRLSSKAESPTQIQGRFRMELNGQVLISSRLVPFTSSWTTYSNTTINAVALSKGIQVLRFVIEKGDFNINYFEFTNTTPLINFQDVVVKQNVTNYFMTASSNSLGTMTYSVLNSNPQGIVSIHPSTGLLTLNGLGSAVIMVSQGATNSFTASTKTANLTITTVTGLGEFGGKNFTIQPNPSSESFKLLDTYLLIESIQVYDIVGTPIENLSASEIENGFGKTWAKGVYFLTAHTKYGSKINYKLVKE